MTPLNTLASGKNSAGDDISLDERDGVIHLRHAGFTATSTASHDADTALGEIACQPMRPARQPQILVASRGFDAFETGAKRILGQPKANFFIHQPEFEMREWWAAHTPNAEPDERVVHLRSKLPDFLKDATDKLHAIVVNLDVLRATNPADVKLFTTPAGLNKVAQALRNGGILGITQSDYDRDLERLVAKQGLTCVYELLPTSEKARKPRMVKALIARKGHYKPQTRRSE